MKFGGKNMNLKKKLTALTVTSSLIIGVFSAGAIANADGVEVYKNGKYELDGEIFRDSNGNGYKSDNEDEIENVSFTVKLYKKTSTGAYKQVAQDRTDDGEYEFEKLTAGTYKVYIKYPSSKKYTTVSPKVKSKYGEYEDRNGFSRKANSKTWVESSPITFPNNVTDDDDDNDDYTVDCGFKVNR